jgi:hypothetical protein
VVDALVFFVITISLYRPRCIQTSDRDGFELFRGKAAIECGAFFSLSRVRDRVVHGEKDFV